MVMAFYSFTNVVRYDCGLEQFRTQNPLLLHVPRHIFKTDIMEGTDYLPEGRVPGKNPATARMIAPVAREWLMRPSP